VSSESEEFMSVEDTDMHKRKGGLMLEESAKLREFAFNIIFSGASRCGHQIFVGLKHLSTSR